MPEATEGQQDQKPATPPAEPEGGTTDQPTEPKPEGKARLLDDKEVQAEIDRRVTQAVKTANEKAAKEREAAIAKAKRESEEAKLFEDGKTKELYELEKSRREELEKLVEEREHRDKVSHLLDVKGVHDPALRDILMNSNGDLTQLDARIESFQELMETMVKKQVTERLGSAPPPKGEVADGKQRPLDTLSGEEWEKYKKDNHIF